MLAYDWPISVNLPPADAETYYDMAIPGDPVTITSSPRAGQWDDGWTEWFLSWSQYLRASGGRGSAWPRPARPRCRP